MKNSTKYQIVCALVPFVSVFAAGSYTQTFLSDVGVSFSAISSYASAVSVIQILVMIINIFAIDRIKNVIRFQFFVISGSLIGSAALIPVCMSGSPGNATFWSVAAIGLIINIFMGLYNVLTFRQAYHVLDMEEYPAVTNNISIINGTLAIVIGLIITQAAFIWDFKYVITGGLAVCVIFCLVSAFLTATMKSKIHKGAMEEPKNKFSFSLLKKREFSYFYVPNLVRGIAIAAMNIMPLIFMKNIDTDSGKVSMLVNIMSVACISGCTLYRIVVKKLSTVSVYFISSIAMFVFMPSLLMGYSVTVFYVFYFILGVFYNINAVSAAVYPSEYVEYENIGTYTSVRLITLTLGQAVGAYVIGLVIDLIPSLVILLACATLQLLSGIAFWKYSKEKS